MTALLEQPLPRNATCPPIEPGATAVPPLVAILRQLASLVGTLTDEQYRMKPVGIVNSSIGGHVRHCLDHVDALLTGLEEGEIDYDRRQRGTDVETCRRAALEAMALQERRLLALPPGVEERPLGIWALLSSSLPRFRFGTSCGRELAFVLSHTVHHNALIGVMAATLGVPVPERFGFAPSTIAHLEKIACAQ